MKLPISAVFALTAALFVCPSRPASTKSFEVLPDESTGGFSIRDFRSLTVTGSFERFPGVIDFDPLAPEGAVVEGTLSGGTTIDRTDHGMSESRVIGDEVTITIEVVAVAAEG